MNRHEDIDMPHKRPTVSCGPERLCGSHDCRSCFGPSAADDDEGPAPDSASHFSDAKAALEALRIAVTRAGSLPSLAGLVSRTRGSLALALEALAEEQAQAKNADAAYVKTALGWLDRAKAAEAELARLRHVHRAVEVIG